MYELTCEIKDLHTPVVQLRFLSVYHVNNLTGKFIALIPCTVAHGKRFQGKILPLYAIGSVLLGEITARLLYCD